MIKKAFTLIELILYMGLLSIFLVVFGQVFMAILDSQVDNQSSAAVDYESQYLLNRIGYDIARASAVTVPGSIGESANSLSLVIGGVTYAYSLVNQNLQLSVAGQPSVINSYTVAVTGFSAVKRGNTQPDKVHYPTVEINLDLSGTSVNFEDQIQTRSLHTSFGTR